MIPDSTPGFYDIAPLADYLQAGTPILTPNLRLARHIKQAWGQARAGAGAHSWPNPVVLSLEQWWQQCYRQAVLADRPLPQLATLQQELELWQRAVMTNPDSPALLRPRGAAQAAREAFHRLCLWEVDWRGAASAEFDGDGDAWLFRQWAISYTRSMVRRQLSTLPELAPQLAAGLPAVRRVLVEFDEIPPLYQRLLQQCSTELLSHHAGAPDARCQVLACEHAEDELRRAAEWCYRHYQARPQARIGVLLPDLQQQRRRVERVFREVFTPAERRTAFANDVLPINFSAGVPLSSCALTQTALGLLGLAVGSETRLADLLALLHSPYRHQAQTDAESQLLARLLQQGRETVSSARLRYLCGQIEAPAGGLALGRQLLELRRRPALRRAQPPSRWSSLFAELLDTLGWPGPAPLDSEEYQQFEHCRTCLQQLSELDPVCAPLRYPAALQRLQQLCLATVFQPQTPPAPIQVLGLLEGRGLQFDHLWIGGMSSAEWPPPHMPHPLLPVSLQKRLAMPHASAARELAYADALLRHYRHCTAGLVASYTRLQDGVAQSPSPLLQDFVPLPTEPPAARYPDYWRARQRETRREYYREQRAPALTAQELQTLRGGSSLLADQSQCPFRAFAKYRLQARPLPAAEAALTAAQRGGLLHRALEHIWTALDGSAALLACRGQARSDLVQQAVQQAVAAARTDPRLPAQRALTRALLALESQRLQRLLLRWLELETQREPFTVIARERAFALALGPLQLNLRIDRMDRLADGKHLLMDYKSGNGAIGDWLGERPRAPQLPLYAQWSGSDPGALCFAVINSKTLEFRGLGERAAAPGIGTDIARASRRQNPPSADWPELLAHWQRSLQQLAQDFLAGQAAVDPAEVRTTCRHCGLEALCRVQ